MKPCSLTLYRGLFYNLEGKPDWPDPIHHGFQAWSPTRIPSNEAGRVKLIIRHILDGARNSPLISASFSIVRAARYAGSSRGGIIFEIRPDDQFPVIDPRKELLQWKEVGRFLAPDKKIDMGEVNEAIEYADRDEEVLLPQIPASFIVRTIEIPAHKI